jgi:integrase
MKLSFYHAKNGIRPGDLVALGRSDILPTPSGRRIVRRTKKRDRLASIPVSTALAAVTDETPDTQAKLIVTKAGAPCAHANDLGEAVSEW